GKPQCAVLVDGFNFDWRAQGARLERDPRFPRRTNVSFVRVADPETLEVRFWERGAGETRSSGTGATGAFAAALARGLVRNRVRVLTPAGPLELRLSDSNSSIYLAGPAELIARGVFLLRE
ncbi:MAG: diaminopimelate epimerase, partial [Acidobacteria bacterium]|nr:diaminopimelate epimerase [Acidobacteriota bacterium]